MSAVVCAPLVGRGRLSPSPSCWGWRRRSTLVHTFIIPESWRWRQEAHWWSQHMQEGAKVLYRKMAGSPQQSPSDLSLSSNVGSLRFPNLFKNFFLSFTFTHSRTLTLHPLASLTLMPTGFIPSSHSPHLSCTLTSVANGPSTFSPGGESHHRTGFSKVALGLCNGRPSCAHQNLNDPSTFTHLWKTRRRLIRAPVLRIPEQFHEAF